MEHYTHLSLVGTGEWCHHVVQVVIRGRVLLEVEWFWFFYWEGAYWRYWRCGPAWWHLMNEFVVLLFLRETTNQSICLDWLLCGRPPSTCVCILISGCAPGRLVQLLTYFCCLFRFDSLGHCKKKSKYSKISEILFDKGFCCCIFSIIVYFPMFWRIL